MRGINSKGESTEQLAGPSALDKLTAAVAEYFPRLVTGDDGGFMSKVAADLAPPKPKAEPKPAPSDDN